MSPPFDPELAVVRFGTGLSPRHPPPADADAMLRRLSGPDVIAARLPIPVFAAQTPTVAELRALNRARRAAGSEGAAQEAYDTARRAAGAAADRQLMTLLARAAATPDGLRERLAWFWADHFALQPRNGFTRHMVEPFVEEAIRPHLAGRFGAMLTAAVTHPLMLDYLDQSRSVGPDSRLGRRTGRGLNENLAREVLELHTIGVGGPYDQTDVRQFAELLTGLVWNQDAGTEFRRNMAEPGAETVLGRVYGPQPSLAGVTAALEALAVHPATARHVSRKLAVHFVAPEPSDALVAAMAGTWDETGGDLGAVVSALLAHPDAWVLERRKVRRPVEFVAAALRALDLPADRLLALSQRDVRRFARTPMAAMGQSWGRPPGPDGWAEDEADWVTPQGLAARIDWAMRVPVHLTQALPDPREFAPVALGSALSPEVSFAAEAAESVPEGIGLVLASAAFQRR
ncbi:DUF1800 domain-containing protein [Wenxinia marina]|uniref:DUF1800 domain-containing protein n=1 Tax=Wenxinia marina DSM 24838 TaxID=1123501 RepID=A0A0D0PDX2_9RHOB|nr:DUF1800 domain-containing protein [Wenxinia marina]KIQ69621.1 hypothetical protein Wenmar_01985 [Wenxinia marina DSM 24838]GGL59809.1 hypothetical protein GCM10011392_12910 [Wenxinia marina]